MCKISKDDVIAQLEWFLENNDWVESLDCDNVDNHTKESLRWVIDYLNKDNERKQGAVGVLNEVRKLMKPLSANTKKEDLWIAGSYKTPEEYVLVNLRQKVLKKIDRLERKGVCEK
jgi:hypothetical protein